MSNKKKRRAVDGFLKSLTYGSAMVSLIVLSAIFLFVFSRGAHLVNLDLLTSDYHAKGYVTEVLALDPCDCLDTPDFKEGIYYVPKFGVAFEDDIDLLGKNVIEIAYIHPNSPLLSMTDKGIGTEKVALKTDYSIIRIAFTDQPTALSRHGAEAMANQLNQADHIREMEFTTKGGGIRGSIITTLYLIGLTLAIALPIGVSAALYINEYASKNRFTDAIRYFIEMLTGVPSIIYGLMGLAVFVPFTTRITSATGGNIISGAMTLSVILMPVIIRTTEESLKVVPDDYRNASLALGASKTQTTFKVVLPSALPGILTATLLAIGRIIGESAALVFAIGTSIKDDISLTERSTSLAVHIWSMMTDEPANIALSSTIALIILMIVLVLNLTIKVISYNYLKRKQGV